MKQCCNYKGTEKKMSDNYLETWNDRSLYRAGVLGNKRKVSRPRLR